MPLIHSHQLNPCKCGSKRTPDLDSDDMMPSWAVQCHDCNQFQHGPNWSCSGAVKAWNDANPVLVVGTPGEMDTAGLEEIFRNPEKH